MAVLSCHAQLAGIYLVKPKYGYYTFFRAPFFRALRAVLAARSALTVTPPSSLNRMVSYKIWLAFND